MVHCFKLYNLTSSEMNRTNKRLAYFVRNGVKVTSLKKVIYIHLSEDQKYSAIGNMFAYFIATGKFHASDKNMKWLRRWSR